MHDYPLLRDLVLLVAIAIPVVLLGHRLHVPSIVGFLLTGMAIGPHALGLIREPGVVQELSEMGVVLLLFAVGLELQLSRVLRLGRVMLVGGGAQVLGTVAVVAIVLLLLGVELRQGLFVGALVAVSSTAIVLKSLQARDELDAPHGRVVVAISVFQDLAVVPMMLLLPLLAGAAPSLGAAAVDVGISVTFVFVVVVAGRYAVPWLLERVLRVHSRELFTLTIVVLGLGAAFLASRFGISLALGAFLAGLVVSESEYGLQALSDVLPFRDVFSGIFFASVGMLLDVGGLAAEPWTALGAVAGIVAIKAVVAALAVLAVGRSLQVAIASGLTLAQIGEFSFVLLAAGAPLGLVGPEPYQLLLAATALSMLVAPFLVRQAVPAGDWIGARTRAVPLRVREQELPAVTALRDHVVVVGFGLNGRNLARALRAAKIPYVVLEQSAQAVRRGREEGEPILFGDGTHPEVLERVGLRRARVVVFAIAAPADELRGVAVARRVNPDAHIVVRTRYVREIEGLQFAGADEVVPEEFETSLEMFSRVLREYGVPASTIRSAVEGARRDHYDMFRGRGRPVALHEAELDLAPGVRLGVETVALEPGAAAIGENARTLRLRSRTGCNLVAVIRGEDVLYTPSDDFTFREKDVAVLAGAPQSLEHALALFRAPADAGAVR